MTTMRALLVLALLGPSTTATWADVAVVNQTRTALLVQADFPQKQGPVHTEAHTIDQTQNYVFIGASADAKRAVKLEIGSGGNAVVLEATDGHNYEIRYDDHGKLTLFEPQ